MTGVWATGDTITAARLNEKGVLADTGGNLNSATKYPGMILYPTTTASGYTADFPVIRNAANAANLNLVYLSSLTSSKYLYYDGTNFTQKGISMDVLDNHSAGGTESSYTYTPGVALDFATYSKIMIVLDGVATAAFNLQMVLNGIVGTSNYSFGARQSGTTTTAISAAATSQLQIGSSTQINKGFAGVIEIFEEAGDGTQLLAISRLLGGGSQTYEIMGHNIVTGNSTITSIKLQTSTSTWATGTRITTYGVKRAI